MKTILRRTVVLGLLVAATAVVAQPPAGGRGPGGPGRGGPAPQEPSLMTWEQAETMMEAAEQYTNDKGWAMSIRIVDQGNNILMIHRLNGVNSFTINVTEMKTIAVTGSKMRSAEYAEKLAAGEIDEIEGAANFGGGVPVYLDGQMIGAIAASGGTPDQDEEVATAGVEAIGASTSK